MAQLPPDSHWASRSQTLPPTATDRWVGEVAGAGDRSCSGRRSPALTTYLVRPRWSLFATATILVLPRSTAGTASALAGSANADMRTAAPRPTAALRRAVRPK